MVSKCQSPIRCTDMYIYIYPYGSLVPGIEIPVSLSEGSVPRTSERGGGALGERRPRYRGTEGYVPMVLLWLPRVVR